MPAGREQRFASGLRLSRAEVTPMRSADGTSILESFAGPASLRAAAVSRLAETLAPAHGPALAPTSCTRAGVRPSTYLVFPRLLPSARLRSCSATRRALEYAE